MARLQHILHSGLIPLFFIWRTFDFVLASIAPRFLPYLGNFSHPNTLKVFNFPHWITGFAQFDGILYMRIASSGYAQFEHAFFPLYPLLIRSFSFFFMQNQLITALIISNISFLLGLFVFEKYLRSILPRNRTGSVRYATLFLLLFPSSFFFGSAYTEGLFFLLVTITFYFANKKDFTFSALAAYFAASTRFIGVFLFIPLVLAQNTSRKHTMAVLAPFLGLATYMYYLFHATQDPLAFFNSQPAFGANRSTHPILFPQVLYRYFKILITTQWSVGYFVALIELTVFVFVLLILILQLRDILRSKKRTLLGLNLFSLANLFVPSLTGTLSSIPRYALLSISFFVYLALLKNVRFKQVLCFIFILLHVALVTLFIQGYFVS